MIFGEKKKKSLWRRLTGWEGKLGGAVLLVAAIVFIIMNLDQLRSSGLIGIQEKSSTVDTPKKEKHFQNHNVVKLRNEVYVINGVDVSIDEMPGYLAELKRDKPDAVIELDTTPDDKVGMVNEIEKAALKVGLAVQKK